MCDGYNQLLKAAELFEEINDKIPRQARRRSRSLQDDTTTPPPLHPMDNVEKIVQRDLVRPILDQVEVDAERDVLKKMVRRWPANKGSLAGVGVRMDCQSRRSGIIGPLFLCDDGSEERGGEEDSKGFFGDGARGT